MQSSVVVHSASWFSIMYCNVCYQAFLKSMKPIHSGAFHWILCSIMLRRANIWSVHPFPLWNPACSWRSLTSIAPSILFSKTLQNILLGTDIYVIPLQLSQCWRSLFFGSFTIRLIPIIGYNICPYISKEVSEGLLAWFSSDVRGLPSLSLTMLTLAKVCPLSWFVSLINCTHFSSFIAILSTWAFLSYQALFLISLSLIRSWIILDLVLRIFDLVVFLSSILLHV